MYLYEKKGGNIDVYELKENRDKIIQYKKDEFNKLSKMDIVFKFLFSDSVYLNGFDCFDTIKQEYIIHKKVKNLKDKLLVDKIYYNTTSNKIIIDGLLHNYFEGLFDKTPIKNIKDGDRILKSFIIPSSDINMVKKGDLLSNDLYEIPYILTIPESLVLLKDLREELLKRVYDKNIDEQLALFDFKDEPIGSYDIDLVNTLIKHNLCGRRKNDNDLEISHSVLKKVRMLNK